MRTCYAIGDVHGEGDRLARLHEAIVADHAAQGGEALIVHLGDLVDRGPDSHGVVARVMAMEAAPPAGAEACCVLGNHEQLMLKAVAGSGADIDALTWLQQGGAETVISYERANGEREDWRAAIDPAHIHWMRTLPTIRREGSWVFVHGGIEPRDFPHCSDEVRLWTRSYRFFESERWPARPELADILVVHGHTPTASFRPDVQRRRINVDTGAVFGGPLTCVVLTPQEQPRFLSA